MDNNNNNNNENKKRRIIILIAAYLGLYFLSTGVSYAAFSSKKSETGETIVSPGVGSTEEAGLVQEQLQFTGPKDQECPLNGGYFTEQEKEIWEGRRPLTVMVENHLDSRPQSSLSRADIVYEAVAEGAITRFMAVYYCRAAGPARRKYDLGPVRSARTYFLDLVSEYGDYPLYAHVGGAGLCSDPTVDNRAKALCQIERYGWKDKEHRSDMDQFALSYNVCRREPERTGKVNATEHTMYCDSQALWQEAEKRDLGAVNDGKSWDKNFQEWQFKDDSSDKGNVNKIAFDFWRDYKDYRVEWDYDKEANVYQRINGGQPHIDFLTQTQLSAKTVAIQFSQETGSVDEHKHILYKLTGQGKALVFQDGKVIEGTWNKKTRQDRTIFKDKTGKEIKFNRGQIWIEILPQGNQVEYGAINQS